MAKLGTKHLVVLASTFPRWKDDTVPGFVLEYAQAMLPYVRGITAVVPHYKGAKRKAELSGGIKVRRFRYAYPYKFENIAYGQFEKTKFYPLKVALYAASEFWTTILAVLRNHPAIINAHWIIPQGFVAVLVGKLLRTKVVVSVHGADVFTLNGKYMRKVKRFVLQQADLVIANSSATQAECKKLWPGREYPVVPMGVNLQQLVAIKRDQPNSRLELLFIGRLKPEKGAYYACEAVKLLREKGLHTHLTVVGDGPEKKRLQRYVATNGLEKAITLAGWVPHEQLPKRYAAADIFVGPSLESKEGWKEAFGLVFAEAAAAGLPIITTGIGGITDIVKDQKTGLIVPERDALRIAGAVEYFCDHPSKAKAMGAAGRAYVAEHFGWESITRQYIELLEPIL